MILRDSRFDGSDEDGSLSANIVASAASRQTQRAKRAEQSILPTLARLTGDHDRRARRP